MIPITLTFQAFGPYVNKQEVDFQKFSDSGVFLIHGITGSGKTTILDAMTYALYGKSSGGQRGDITSMRCQMAREDMPTEVEFIFRISDKTYKFTRTIHIRTKRNGSKEYSVSQNALYLNKDGIFIPFFENPKIKDIEQKSCELIGLNHEQFIQVIMLPQGKFEKLLMSKSDEKEEILVTLFNAEKWQEAAEWICSQAKDILKDIALKKEHIAVMLKSEDADSTENLQNKALELSMFIDANMKEKHEKFELLSQEKSKYQLQNDLYNLFEEKSKTEKELEKINENESNMKLLQTKLEKGRKAINVSQTYNMVMNMHKQLQEAKQKLENEERNYLNCIENKTKTENVLENLKKNENHIEKLKESKIKAESLIDVYKEIAVAKFESENEAQKLVKISEEITKKQDLYNSSKEKHHSLTKQKEFIFNNYSLKLPELQAKWEKHNLLEKKSFELKSFEEDTGKDRLNLSKLNKQLENQQKNIILMKAAYEEVHNKYIEGSAYLIGESLIEGEECPVCGSVHHPKKAAPAVESVDISTVKNLSSELERLNDEANIIINLIAKQEASLSAKNDKIINLADEVQALKASLSCESKEDVFQALEKAEAEIKKLNNIVAEESKYSAMSLNLDKELSELTIKLNEQSKLKEEKSAKFVSLSSRKIEKIDNEDALLKIIQSYKFEIDKYLNDLDSLTERKNSAEKLLSSSFAKLNLLKEDVENKNDEYEKGKSDYYQLLKENSFADTQEFKSFLVEQKFIDEWEEQINAYIIRRGTAESNLKKLTEFTANKEKPDIEKIKNSISNMEYAITELEKQLALNTEKKSRIEKIIKATEKEQKTLEALVKKYDTYNSFGVTLRGDKGISLRRYVLGVMLTSVTAEANRLLKNVHDGRYQLCRTLEGMGRSRKAGLDLEVHDAYSGEKRSVAGLSGGEKFLVSLALSLGLSAVVQAQSGGIRIDTMFIDEGFGSLDSSSIRDAMNILSSVKGSKRLVGIISHVQMLKETIESTISVEKSRSGSTLVIKN